MNPVIYAADIGSIKSGNFGWARVDPEQDTATHVERNDGSEIGEIVDAVQHDLTVRRRGVALGFECPLFVPVPEDPILLGAARPGESEHAWSAGAGAAALATGLVQAAWFLRELRSRCPDAAAYLDWDEFVGVGEGLFLWEAFVTGKAKAARMSMTPSSLPRRLSQRLPRCGGNVLSILFGICSAKTGKWYPTTATYCADDRNPLSRNGFHLLDGHRSTKADNGRHSTARNTILSCPPPGDAMNAHRAGRPC